MLGQDTYTALGSAKTSAIEQTHQVRSMHQLGNAMDWKERIVGALPNSERLPCPKDNRPSVVKIPQSAESCQGLKELRGKALNSPKGLARMGYYERTIKIEHL